MKFGKRLRKQSGNQGQQIKKWPRERRRGITISLQIISTSYFMLTSCASRADNSTFDQLLRRKVGQRLTYISVYRRPSPTTVFMELSHSPMRQLPEQLPLEPQVTLVNPADLPRNPIKMRLDFYRPNPGTPFDGVLMQNIGVRMPIEIEGDHFVDLLNKARAAMDAEFPAPIFPFPTFSDKHYWNFDVYNEDLANFFGRNFDILTQGLVSFNFEIISNSSGDILTYPYSMTKFGSHLRGDIFERKITKKDTFMDLFSFPFRLWVLKLAEFHTQPGEMLVE